MSLLIGSLIIGLILSLLAMGVFISFRIFNFPDITVEGSITFGAAITAAVIQLDLHPLLATFLGFTGGFLAGMTTGVLHAKFKINSLLAGILVMTALYSVNLHVMGKSNIPLLTQTTLFTYVETLTRSVFPDSETVSLAGWNVQLRDLMTMVVLLIAIALAGSILRWFFRSHFGTAMRATGNNQNMIRALGVNTDWMIILGLGLANGMIGLSGSLLAQYQGFADAQMGIGMLVWGLASVIIGEALINTRSVGLLIAGAIMGSVFFRILVAIALRLGMNPNDLKLITALFVLAALVLPSLVKRFNIKPLVNDNR
ncbi:MAG: ABC transporter permease [Bacteroidales bacterium]|nr:ABC transporter permease [Bacteroidales bacterium]